MPARKKAAATASKASSSKASSSSSTSDSKPVKRLSSKTTKKDEKETASAPDKQIVKITIRGARIFREIYEIRGAFDITIGLSDGTEAKIWSGLDKGPPRKLKFPDAETLVNAARKNMWKNIDSYPLNPQKASIFKYDPGLINFKFKALVRVMKILYSLKRFNVS